MAGFMCLYQTVTFIWFISMQCTYSKTTQSSICSGIPDFEELSLSENDIEFNIIVLPSQLPSQRIIRLSGRKLQSVFLQARQGPDPLFDLIGSWSNLTSPEGHRLVTCGEASHSVGLYVSDGRANYTITFAWNGVCTKNTTFFLFALDAGNTTWQHIRVNCHNSLTISDNKEFSMWTKFSSCSVTCGKGLQIRTRKCHLERCDGPTEDVQICIKGSCPNVVCIDKFVNCKNWSRHCNGSFGLWIKVNCPQTCKICKSPQNEMVLCSDERKFLRSCKKWSQQNLCKWGRWSKIVSNRCPKSCGIC
ncbi:unnamed protein product [Clavelina lepadiformis]|uniref:ShKT domain-containing protein n=1 Tax=Clavelina lepadiformis TaxID=159417 RepID=A0ABP0G1V5_CLALP